MKNKCTIITGELAEKITFHNQIIKHPDSKNKFETDLLEIKDLNKAQSVDLAYDILVIEDSVEEVYQILTDVTPLEEINNVLVLTSKNSLAAINKVNVQSIRLITFDFMLPGVNSSKEVDINYKKVRSTFPDVPMICISQVADQEDLSPVVNDIRKRKTSVFDKSLLNGALTTILKDKLAIASLEEEVIDLNQKLNRSEEKNLELELLLEVGKSFTDYYDEEDFSGILIGSSMAMQEIKKQITEFSKTNDTIFLRGEAGTGKSHIANIIHKLSARKNEIFARKDLGTLTPTVIESQLFGHMKGSFTGADSDKIGIFEAADGGTLFLDEIHNLNEECQSKLLHVIEDKVITRVGSNKEIHVDVKLIIASNENNAFLQNSKHFRQDLLQRIEGRTIILPPLRDMKGDIEALCQSSLERTFNKKLGNSFQFKIEPEALQLLKRQDWPGNIRKLQSTIEIAAEKIINRDKIGNNGTVKVSKKAIETVLINSRKDISSISDTNSEATNTEKKEINAQSYLGKMNQAIETMISNNTLCNQQALADGMHLSRTSISNNFNNNFVALGDTLIDDPNSYPFVLDFIVQSKEVKWITPIYNYLMSRNFNFI